MAIADAHGNELKNTGYEIFVGILSVLSIVNIVLLYAVEDPNLDSVLHVMNVLLSAIFLADFTYRLLTAESKSHYFFRQFGWADLLASLPFEQAKILRVFRLVRVFRLLREYGVKNITRSLIKDRAGSALLTLLLMGILVLEFGQPRDPQHRAVRRRARTSPPGPTRSGTSIVTISTVGYGDRIPLRTTVGSSARSSSSSASASSARSPATSRTSSSSPAKEPVEEASSPALDPRTRMNRLQGAHGPATSRDGRDRPSLGR